ncbi:MAG: benzoate/H(+) symporter BenE family transporter [Brucellaceae bacterium]|nr:benzoate/H(+) symporter BenE family transporter [Brucellaceae bacterium]
MTTRLSIPAAALVAAIVGFGGTLALIIAAADALGASREQTASWVTAVCLALAVETAYLSWRTKMPVVTAWSTPGLALLAAAGGFTMNDAVGAFIMVAVLLIVTGTLRPLSRLVGRIPASLSSGMLAGILVSFAIGAVKAAGSDPLLVLPLAVLFFAVRLFNPALSVLAVLVAGVVLAWALGRIDAFPEPEFSTLVFTEPSFTLAGFFGLALPIYLVTMASQNLAGIAVLRAAGYEPPSGLLVWFTGAISLLSAPFNAVTTNLAAISAAICTGPDAHPDPAERWKTGPYYALWYLIFALFGASLVALFDALPPQLIILVAGLGLLAPLANALTMALGDAGLRTAAVVAFAVTASGVTMAGIGSAFWGLMAGLFVAALDVAGKRYLKQ